MKGSTFDDLLQGISLSIPKSEEPSAATEANANKQVEGHPVAPSKANALQRNAG